MNEEYKEYKVRCPNQDCYKIWNSSKEAEVFDCPSCGEWVHPTQHRVYSTNLKLLVDEKLGE